MIRKLSTRRGSFRILAALLAAVALGCLPALASPDDSPRQRRQAAERDIAEGETDNVDYAKQIQPLLAKRCYACHGPKKQEGALRLDVRSAAMRGGERGPAIVLEKASESLLVKAVSGESDEVDQMPQDDDPLSDEEVKLLRDWIDQGAHWPEAD